MTRQVEDVVFAGSFSECLRHFATAMNERFPKGSKGSEKARVPMAEFCGVGPAAPGEWLLRGREPGGETWVKLLFYLSIQGYRIKELVRMADDIRNFAELIGFGVITSEQAAKELGYTDTSRIYQIIRGVNRPMDDRAAKMYSLWKQHKDELETKKAAAEKRYLLDLSEGASCTSNPEEIPVARKSFRGSLLFRLMDVLNETLAEENGDISIDDLGPEEQQTVLRLSARLSSLSAGIISGHSS